MASLHAVATETDDDLTDWDRSWDGDPDDDPAGDPDDSWDVGRAIGQHPDRGAGEASGPGEATGLEEGPGEARSSAVRLAELRSAGLIRRASEQADVGVGQSLPVPVSLRSLFGGAGLRRGGTVAVTVTAAPQPASTSTSTSMSTSMSVSTSTPTSAVSTLASFPARAMALRTGSRRGAPGGVATVRSIGVTPPGSAGSLGAAALLRPPASPILPRAGTGEQAVAPGATSLLFALLAEATEAGSWGAVVGMPQLGLVAAAEAGVAVERLALVPHPGPDWTSVVAALLDGVDIVVVATPGPVSAQVAGRLTARARQRGVVLMPMGQWPGADLTLEVTGSAWHGLGQGRGRLRRRELSVLAHGRGAAARPRQVQVWLPDAPGSVPAPMTAAGPMTPAGSLAPVGSMTPEVAETAVLVPTLDLAG